MRILGIGHSTDLGAMYLQLAAAGHELRVYASEHAEHGTMAGLLTHVSDSASQLDWIRAAGDDGYIVFESAEHGAQQDALRRDGFFVIGGSALGDRLENERAFGQRALAELGLPIITAHEFNDFERAICFVRERPGRYAFKLNGSQAASFRNFVSRAEDGSDMLALLRGQHARLASAGLSDVSFVLMDYVEGVETGVGAYFDGQQFLSPVCLDWEHKRFFPGELGELTGEMGTLVTYEHGQALFSRTLALLAPALSASGYVGYINLNTIINEQGIWPLELTCRFGYPGYAILSALQPDGWDDLFVALRSKRGSFRAAPGFALGVVLNVPPYPYRFGYDSLSRGLPITFAPSLSDEDRRSLQLGEVALEAGQLVTSGVVGYTMVATGVAATVEQAQARAYALADQVYVPNLRYRTDIGSDFLRSGRARLQRLGILP